MIPRYSLPEIADLFTDEARFGAWLEVEVLAVEAWAELGVVPADAARAVRERARVDVAAVHEREKVTDHDVAAFVDVVQESVGQPEGAWVHYGLTSSDVVDTALALQMTRALDRILPAAEQMESAIAARAPRVPRHADGRTHPRDPRRANHVRHEAWRCGRCRCGAIASGCCGPATRSRSGKLSGAVGTFSNIDPAVERYVCEHLGLRPVPATQVLPRDRHAEVLYACTSLGTSIESFALEIRHLQRTEVREAEEAFREGQKGSSAMPHKRNPIKSEQLCGLARVLRGNLQAALEDVALWHERDISHSSVERIIVPDSLMLAFYVIVAVHQGHLESARLPRADARAISTRRSGSCSANRCCSHWSKPAPAATTRTESCSATR